MSESEIKQLNKDREPSWWEVLNMGLAILMIALWLCQIPPLRGVGALEVFVCFLAFSASIARSCHERVERRLMRLEHANRWPHPL